MSTPAQELRVTRHAIEQFIAKADKNLNEQVAEERIRDIFVTSEYVPPKKRKGGTKKRLGQSIRVAFYKALTLFLVIVDGAIVTLYPVKRTRSGYCNWSDGVFC